jgi:hypothetical protein
LAHVWQLYTYMHAYMHTHIKLIFFSILLEYTNVFVIAI